MSEKNGSKRRNKWKIFKKIGLAIWRIAETIFSGKSDEMSEVAGVKTVYIWAQVTSFSKIAFFTFFE